MMGDRQCPLCGAELAADNRWGLCPKCLLARGMQVGSMAETEQASRGRIRPPAPEQIAAHFPMLDMIELIGSGGMGAVYKARQRDLDRFVALKILPSDVGRDPAFAERFLREARAMARLNHPNVVTVHDFGQIDGMYYLMMAYVDGVNLRQAIQGKRISPRDALAIVPQICDALQYAHDEGIVHRDIKPENILLDRKGRVFVADFGLAKLLSYDAADARLTSPGQTMGTPHYMAPEQIDHPLEVDHRADVYSLGVVLYEMLTGELPLGRFAPPSQKAKIDVRLDEVVLRTLENEPLRRYQAVSQLKTDLENITGGRVPAGYEYRSKTTIFGWPLVHIAHGYDPVTGRNNRTAKGIIAIGDRAIGVLAIGGAACGGICIGGLTAGLITLGGMSVGIMAAIGGIAVGGVAMGGGALGVIAFGGAAVGVVAVGGGAYGYYAFGGVADGMHALGDNVFDPEAFRFFHQWLPDSMLERWEPFMDEPL